MPSDIVRTHDVPQAGLCQMTSRRSSSAKEAIGSFASTVCEHVYLYYKVSLLSMLF